jgi:hypothetical protein
MTGTLLGMSIQGQPRRRAPGAAPVVRSIPQARTCAAPGCQARLSRYNPTRHCSLHDGWDAARHHRAARRRPTAATQAGRRV